MRRVLREPLLHFLALGAALFLLHALRGAPGSVSGGPARAPAAEILVTLDDLDQMSTVFARTWQRPPTLEEQQGLITDFVRSEIYYREAIAIGLDRGDEVLRRRLRQKMEFIYEEVSSWAEPTDEDLGAFMRKHPEKYVTDPAIAFRQVFVSPYRRGASAESDAREILARLVGGADPDSVGDATMLEEEVRLSPLWDIRKQFGDEFATRLLDAAPGAWAGPMRSGFGLHLVLVKERRAGRLPDLREVRETVKRDWTIERQKELKDAAYAKIRERYTVTVERPRTVPGPGGAAASTTVTAR